MRAFRTGARSIAGRVVVEARRLGMRSGFMVVSVVMTVLLAACTSLGPAAPRRASPRPALVAGGPACTYVLGPGIHKIKHAINGMQENRRFDSYFSNCL